MDENETADFDSTLNEEDGTEVNETSQPKPQAGSAVKLLKQRNEARAKLQDMEKTHVPAEEVAKMKEKMSQLEEMIVGKQLQDEVTKEKTHFFEWMPKAKELESDIDRLMTEKDLTVEEAFRLAAAEKNPALLMDEQTLNKMDSNSWLSWVPRDNTKKTTADMAAEWMTMDDAQNLSDDEFLKITEEMGKKDRIAQWLLR